MPRIRSIHPSFWTDERMAELPFGARLLFIGTWTFADDEGRLEDNAQRLRLQVFPGGGVTTPQVEEWLMLMSNPTGPLIKYEIEGRRYIQVRNFKRYQSPKNPTPSRIPPPPLSLTPLLPQDYPKTSPALPQGYPLEREGEGERDRERDTPKGARKLRASPDPRVKEVLDAVKAYFGYPAQGVPDPVPSYGKEGHAVKRMLDRGFSPDAIESAWKGKVEARGGKHYVSMVWVNEDIGKEVKGGEPGEHPAPHGGAAFDFGGLKDTGIDRG